MYTKRKQKNIFSDIKPALLTLKMSMLYSEDIAWGITN